MVGGGEKNKTSAWWCAWWRKIYQTLRVLGDVKCPAGGTRLLCTILALLGTILKPSRIHITSFKGSFPLHVGRGGCCPKGIGSKFPLQHASGESIASCRLMQHNDYWLTGCQFDSVTLWAVADVLPLGTANFLKLFVPSRGLWDSHHLNLRWKLQKGRGFPSPRARRIRSSTDEAEQSTESFFFNVQAGTARDPLVHGGSNFNHIDVQMIWSLANGIEMW